MVFHLMHLKESFAGDHSYVTRITASPIAQAQDVEQIHLAQCRILGLDWRKTLSSFFVG